MVKALLTISPNYSCVRWLMRLILALNLVCSFASVLVSAAARYGNFQKDFVVTWTPDNVKFLDGGQSLQLLLNESAGSAFASKNGYLFGRIDMQIKLVAGNSAGTVTAYYLSSETSNHDELDFEFLGNKSGEPYILQTNVFSNGTGQREQRIYLWFDPTADFHTYSITWTHHRVVFLVDGVTIRVFSNNAAAGIPYLNSQPMRVFSSLWNGDSWATRGGIDKIDWTQSPFVASYRNFRASACVANNASQGTACSVTATNQINSAISSPISRNSFNRSKLQWVQKNFMVYDYCTDKDRYPTAPLDCVKIR